MEDRAISTVDIKNHSSSSICCCFLNFQKIEVQFPASMWGAGLINASNSSVMKSNTLFWHPYIHMDIHIL